MRKHLLNAPLAFRVAGVLLPAALFAPVLAGCGGGSSNSGNTGINIVNGSNGLGGSTIDPAGDGTSGFSGKVISTPSTPTSTTQSPLGGAKIVASLADGTVVGSAVSGSDGSYKIPLVPGTFVLTPQPISDTVVPVASAQQYRVTLRTFTSVNFSYYDKSKIK